MKLEHLLRYADYLDTNGKMVKWRSILYALIIPIIPTFECLTDSFERMCILHKILWQYASSKALIRNYRGHFLLLLQNVVSRLSPDRLSTFPWISCKYCHLECLNSSYPWNRCCIGLAHDRSYKYAGAGIINWNAQRYWVE